MLVMAAFPESGHEQRVIGLFLPAISFTNMAAVRT